MNRNDDAFDAGLRATWREAVMPCRRPWPGACARS